MVATPILCSPLRIAAVFRFATLNKSLRRVPSPAADCGRLSICYDLAMATRGKRYAADCGRLSICYDCLRRILLEKQSDSPFHASKKLELGGRLRCWLAFLPNIDLDPSILIVSDCQKSYLTLFRHYCAHAFHMDISILYRRTMPRINRILHHRESVFQQVLTESSIRLARFWRVSRQIEHGYDPHRTPPPWSLRNRACLSHHDPDPSSKSSRSAASGNPSGKARSDLPAVKA